jgi:hypothetical protein
VIDLPISTLIAQSSVLGGPWIDISDCVFVSAGPIKEKALQMLVEEVEKRSGVHFPKVARLADAGGRPAMVVTTREAASQVGIDAKKVPGNDSPRPIPDGFALHLDSRMRKEPTLLAIGNDARGAMYAVGCFLRTARYGEGKVEFPADFSIVTAPRYPLRGHQLGYRPRSNTYDQWSVEQYEQYLRDLIVWGANAVELIPPQSSNDNISGKADFQAQAWGMNARLSQLIGGDYGLEVHAWIPVDDRVVPGTEFGSLKPWETVCPSNRDGRKYILDDRRRLFSEMPHLDAVFVPGGDPGGCTCDKCQPYAKTFIGLCADVARILAESHPEGKVWLSDQIFSFEDEEYLCDYLEREHPNWLGGLVYGPSSVPTVEEMRQLVSPRYPIRFYPDITHSARCQYPVIDWDPAYGLIEGREVINPRPVDEKHIQNLLSPYACGSISYSDGAHDDVNKIIWSALDWDPSREARGIVLEYARYFLGEEFAERFTEGTLMLEQNWQGPLATSKVVPETLGFWQAMEKEAPPKVLNNWRFQLGLMRAYLDAFVQQRVLADIEAEQKAREILRGAAEGDPDAAMRKAHKSLAESQARTVAPEWRERMNELGRSLRENIGMKLAAVLGAEPERADFLDDLDEPLNNGRWMMTEMEKLLRSDDEAEKRAGIARILYWEDPGPGGFYDDLGTPTRQAHLVYPKPVSEDPGRLETAAQEIDHKGLKGGRMSWRTTACAFRKSSLHMRYEGLDPSGRYLLRVTYPAHRPGTSVRLVANGQFELQPMTAMPRELHQREYEIPAEATTSGKLELAWSRKGARCVCLCEAWLIRQS